MSSPVDLRPESEQAESASLDSLLRSAAEGDRAAFAALYDRLSPAVYAVARVRATERAAEAVVIEVFLGLWRAVPHFPRQGLPAGVWATAVITASLHRERLDRGLAESGRHVHEREHQRTAAAPRHGRTPH